MRRHHRSSLWPFALLHSFFQGALTIVVSLPSSNGYTMAECDAPCRAEKELFHLFFVFFFFSILSSDNQSMRRYYKTVAAVAAANKMKPSRPVAFLTCFFSLTIIVASFEFGLLCNITTTTTTRNDVHRASEERRNRGTFTDDKKMISGDYLSL